MSWIKKITKTFSYLIFLCVSVAVLLEVIFRVLPEFLVSLSFAENYEERHGLG